jgi:hypothetical protein
MSAKSFVVLGAAGVLAMSLAGCVSYGAYGYDYGYYDDAAYSPYYGYYGYGYAPVVIGGGYYRPRVYRRSYRHYSYRHHRFHRHH